ncbi:hypothetical protein AY599_00300 [Leptolyngbya valderiana BDU 20041]|nr:hypothetical protein AY599_00300 [Leptolyngbya valderiana BDU 20041]
MKLLTELKRRNVFRVALFYIVASWVVVQVAETVLPIFEVPDAFLRGIIVFLAIGFVPALIFAWAFELTPDGLKLDRDAPQDAASRQNSARKLNLATVIAALCAISLIVLDRLIPEEPETAPSPSVESFHPVGSHQQRAADSGSTSVAVLPFADLSPDGNQAYFAEGISEEILNVLAKVPGLRVASRTSSFVFRNEEKSIPVIAETLDVGHVLEGSVRKAGNRIRITAQLIRADNDAHLWSETFDRELSTENLFAIQDEIASAIVTSLEESLGLVEPVGVAVPSTTDNLDAYELFLRAKGARSVMSAESERAQLELLEQAVALDPDFAEAWGALASSLVHLPTWDHSLDSPSYRLRGRRAAERAIELDSKNTEAWEALYFSHYYLHEWETADRVAEQARAATSDFLVGAQTLLGLGYLERARQQADRLIATDDEYENFWHLIKGLTYEAEGRYQEAMDLIRTAILMGYHGSASETLADMYLDMDRQDVWLMQHANHYRDHDPELIPLLPHLMELDIAYRNGDSQASRRFVAIARELGFTVEELTAPGPNWGLRVPFTIASALGENEAVVEQYRHHSPKFWMWTPSLQSFRRSEAFREFVEESGMLEYWRRNGWPDKCRPIVNDAGEDDFECN